MAPGRTALTCAAVALVLLGGAAATVDAESCRDEDCSTNDSVHVTGGYQPSVELTASVGTEREHGGAPDWVRTCSYRELTGADALAWVSPRATPLTHTDVAAGYDADSVWVMIRCPAHPHPVIAADVYAIYQPGDPPRRVIDLVVSRAYDQTELTEFELEASPEGSPDRPLLTQLPTWLWVDGDQWGPVSASAGLPGVTATVTAMPVDEVIWSLSGQHVPTSITCATPGLPFDPTRLDAAQPSHCVLTPTRTTRIGTSAITLVTTWRYAVACAPVACTTTLPEVTAESSRPVSIIEVRGVVTR